MIQIKNFFIQLFYIKKAKAHFPNISGFTAKKIPPEKYLKGFSEKLNESNAKFAINYNKLSFAIAT